MDNKGSEILGAVLGAAALLALSVFTLLHLWREFVVPVTGWAQVDASGVVFLSALVASFNQSVYQEHQATESPLIMGFIKYGIVWAMIGIAHLIK